MVKSKKLINKVINTKDKDFIIKCGIDVKKLKLFTEEEIEHLKERIQLD